MKRPLTKASKQIENHFIKAHAAYATRPIICKFEYMDGETKQIKTFEREIEFPERTPIAFAAVCQWAHEVFHQEKLALKRRIDELEDQLIGDAK